MAAAAKAAPKLVVRTFNKINAAGLARFDPSMFNIREDNDAGAVNNIRTDRAHRVGQHLLIYREMDRR